MGKSSKRALMLVLALCLAQAPILGFGTKLVGAQTAPAPGYPKAYIDGTGYSMTKVSGTYTSGALYRYQTTLGAGSYTYYFSASDSRGATTTGGTFSGPTVTQGTTQEKEATTLTISPSSFTLVSGQSHIFTVTITAGGSPIGGETVIINFSVTTGTVSASDTVGDPGTALFIYTAPTVSTPTTVTVTASFDGSDQYESSTKSASGTIKPIWVIVAVVLIGAVVGIIAFVMLKKLVCTIF